METRKLIRSGASSLVISLPSTWLSQNGLKKGSTLFLRLRKDAVIVSPSAEESESKSETYRISNKALFLIKEELTHCFLKNVKNIIINSNENLREIIELIKNFPGFDYELKNGKVHITNLLEKKSINPEIELRKIFLLNKTVLSLIEQCKDSEVNEIILLTNNLKRKTLIAESVLNDYLDAPYRKDAALIGISKAILLKRTYQELPFLFDSELYLMRQLLHLQEQKKVLKELKHIRRILEKAFRKESISAVIEVKANIKSLIEGVHNMINRTQDVQETKALGAVESIYNSLLKMLYS